MENKFCIHDVKTIIELSKPEDIKKYLSSGWVMLNTGMTKDAYGEHVYFVLGNTDKDSQ